MNFKRWIVLCLTGWGGLISVVSAGDKVLIYTRNGEGYVHDNIAASVTALEHICTRHLIETMVTDDPAIFTDQSLQSFIAIIFSNTNNQAFVTDEQRLAFVRYIQAGGAFIGIHSACASERNWPWFWSMIGGRFVRHPALQYFDIRVIDPSHDSTHFLPNPWKWEDECYFIDHLNPDIDILLAVDLRTLQDDPQQTFPGSVFGDFYPLAWYHEFDGGRQFYTALGHKIEYYEDAHFIRHLEGGILWAIGDKKPLDYSRVKSDLKIERIPSDQ